MKRKPILLFIFITSLFFPCIAFGQTTLLQEGFDSAVFPPTGWLIKNKGSDPIGESWIRAIDAQNVHSGTGAAFSQDGVAGERMEEWLVSKPLVVPANSNLTLDFWNRLQWNNYSDGPEYAIISSTDTVAASFIDTVYVLPGKDPATWTKVQLRLPDYSGKTIYIAFVHTSPNGFADAWVVDDVAVTYTIKTVADVGAVKVFAPLPIIWVGTPITPNVLIRNFGTSSQTGFRVSFVVKTSGGAIVYTDTTTYTGTLLAGASDSVVFNRSWSPTSGGQDTMIARTHLVGDSQPSNDAISIPLEIAQRYHTGGPDAFGYNWIDSDTAGGPIFNWIELSKTGKQIKFAYSNLSGTDSTLNAQSNPPLVIGFPFPYYGIKRDTLSVDINGEIILKWNNPWYPGGNPFNWNLPSFPTATIPANIAVFWDNLERMSPNAIAYYQQLGQAPSRYIVVEWKDFSSNYARDSANYLTFEAILYENGDIVLQYKDVVVGHPAVDSGVGATVGMQNDDYKIGLQYELNGNPRGNRLRDGLAIRFYLPGNDLVPPTIVHKPQTNSFRVTEIIAAQFSDAQGISEDSLFYNVGSNWVASTHDSINAATGTYYYHIPTQPRGTVVRYYILAKDGSTTKNLSVAPSSAPATPYSYKVLPTAGVKILFAYDSNQDWRSYKDNPTFLDALNKTGFIYDTFDRSAGDGQFTFYDLVFANSPGPGAFEDEGTSAEWLMTFLDSGTPTNKKKLFMTSQGYAYMQYGYANDVPVHKFFTQYLHSEFTAGGRDGLDGDPTAYSSGTILGEVDDYITNGQAIKVFALSPNVIHSTRPLITIDTSITFARFGLNMYAQGWPCGQKFKGEKFNSVFLSFDLWNIDSTKRADFLKRAKAWLDNPDNPMAVEENANYSKLPAAYALKQNFPNPFNPATTIEYDLPKQTLVVLKIYDVLGRQVADLVNTVQEAGTYKMVFNGSNLSSGVYFYRLQAGMYVATKKFLLVR